MPFLADLRARGLLNDSSEGAAEAFGSGEPLAGYIGFDPTAPSLHVGSLVPIMALRRFQQAGHHPIALVGGATGMIGDPSGKSSERSLQTLDEVQANVEGIRRQLEPFLDFEVRTNPARMVNNLDWLGGMDILTFLRDVGKHFSVNVLLRRDNVRRRLESEEGGISYTEFSYGLLQAYDFLELHRRHGCSVQMGGSDQWGNIVGGIDFVRRVTGKRVHGVTFPLVTTSSGVKFGKTEAGTIWLDPARTSPFRFYQFWLQVEDADVVRYLRHFTLLGSEEIDGLAESVETRPEGREAQRRLAEEMTGIVHGATGLTKARQASTVLFGGDFEGLEGPEIAEIFADVPSTLVPRSALAAPGMPFVDLLAGTGLVPSRSEARRALQGGGIYLNNVRITEMDRQLTEKDLLDGGFAVLRKGKRSHHLVRVEDARGARG